MWEKRVSGGKVTEAACPADSGVVSRLSIKPVRSKRKGGRLYKNSGNGEKVITREVVGMKENKD